MLLRLSPTPRLFSDMSRLRLDTLIRLRWLAIGGQTIAILVVRFGLGFELPLLECFAVLSLSIIVNIVSRLRFPTSIRLGDRAALIYLGFDLVQLSALLFLTGGLSNAFALLLLVPIVVAASTLNARLTLFLGGVGLTLAAILAFWHQPLPWYANDSYRPPTLIVLGEWLSLAGAMGFMGLYVFRVANEAQQLSDALTAAELALIHEQHLSQLDGLAAAAAHELGTPLATIALVAKELERDPNLQQSHSEDITLLRDQITRCREILGKLTSLDSPQDGHFHCITLPHLIEDIVAPQRQFGINLDVTCAGTGVDPVGWRDPAIVYGLGNLIENAVDFAKQSVQIDVRWTERTVSIRVIDDGPGFRPDILQRLGEPYVTSRPSQGADPHQDDKDIGLGLGFFIAKRLIERSGGKILLTNRDQPAQGAEVRIDWERHQFESGRHITPLVSR